MTVLEKCQQRGGGAIGGDAGKIEWKSPEVGTRAVSRGQNE